MKADLPAGITVQGADELLKFLKGLDENLRASRLQESWEAMLELVLLAVRERVPHWRGNLSTDLGTELYIDEPLISGVVFSDTTYAPFQERGTAPYFPNVDALEPWAEAHDLSAWYVANVIALQGLPPTKFFELGFEDVKDEVVRLVDDVVMSIIEAEAAAAGIGGT